MNAFFIFLGALALLLAGLAARAVGGMQDEIRTRRIGTGVPACAQAQLP